MKILLTGGTGYIGSHTAIELIENGNDIVIVDNLSNSSKEVINRLNKITKTKVPFYEVDIRNKSKLEEIFEQVTFFENRRLYGSPLKGKSVFCCVIRLGKMEKYSLAAMP